MAKVDTVKVVRDGVTVVVNVGDKKSSDKPYVSGEAKQTVKRTANSVKSAEK